MKLHRRSAKRGRIEIIPMIDTILILLIFYMSFSTFSKKEKRLVARMPVIAEAATPIAPTHVPLDIVLHVRSADEILANDALYTSDSLREALLQLAAIGQETTIVIEAEPDTSYQAVIAALDACAQARLKKVAFRPLPDKLAAAQ